MTFQHTPFSQSPNTRRLLPARTVQGAVDVYTKIASTKGSVLKPVIGDHASIDDLLRRHHACWDAQ
jgi:hypothetical protein